MRLGVLDRERRGRGDAGEHGDAGDERLVDHLEAEAGGDEEEVGLFRCRSVCAGRKRPCRLERAAPFDKLGANGRGCGEGADQLVQGVVAADILIGRDDAARRVAGRGGREPRRWRR